MLIDTHAHLQLSDFADDRDQVIDRCQAQSMQVINIGTNFTDSGLAVELSNKYDWCFSVIGIHPTEIFDRSFNEVDFTQLINKKVVAIGEIGLDLWHLDWIKEKYNLTDQQIFDQQLAVFEQQLKFAHDKNLAVVIHGRNNQDEKINVYDLILKKLTEYKIDRAVFHCFGGDLKSAQAIIASGYYLGFDGPITFKKNDALRQMVETLPLEKILAETDCPFLAPEPVRGKKNEPANVKYIVEKIAEIKNLSYQEVEDKLWQNANQLFRLN